MNLRMQLTGLEDTLWRLQTLPGKVHNRVLRPAVGAASTIMLQAMRKTVPVESGHLRKSLGRKKWTRGMGLVGEVLGPRTGMKDYVMMKRGWLAGERRPEDPAKIGHLQDTKSRVVKPHAIPIKHGPHAGRTIMHPGYTPSGFARRADASAGPAARDMLKQKIIEGIEKVAAKR